MQTSIAKPIHWKACAVCLAFMLPTINSANPAGPNAASRSICAEREILLATVVEAHGEVPNAASAKLAEVSIALMQARVACDEERIEDALALYDRIIAEIGLVRSQVTDANE
jgi:hypothetical protein